jgi:hypothetical protein
MVLPPSNVPPESQPWARTIESLISQGAVDLNSLSTKTDAAFKGQNATLGQLSGQITELNTQQASIVAQQDTLTTLVNSQISLDSNAQSSTNMAFSNVQTTYSSYTFGVPAGYNWATFFITGQQGTSSASCAGTFDVVGGGSVTVSIMAYTTNPTTAYSGNYVGFDGVIMFTK